MWTTAVRAPGERATSSYLKVVHASEAKDLRQFVERGHHLASERGICQIARQQLVAIPTFDPRLEIAIEGGVEEDARLHRRHLALRERHAKTQTRRAAAVVHRFTEIDVLDAFHAAALDDDAIEESACSRCLLRLLGCDDRHRPVGRVSTCELNGYAETAS